MSAKMTDEQAEYKTIVDNDETIKLADDSKFKEVLKEKYYA